MLELAAGEVALVLSGEAHALRTAPGVRAEPHPGLRAAGNADDIPDVPPVERFGHGSRVTARVLSGRLRAAWPADVTRAALPAALPAERGFLQADTLALAGIGPGSTALLTRLAETLLIATLRHHPACRRLLTGDARDPVDEAVRLIAAAPAQSWTVESLARAVGMGRSNFAAHFSQQQGKAPMEVVAEYRMERAARLLREGRMKIVEIAELVGYGSEAAFSRRFSRHFAITPSQMREQARAAARAVKPAAVRSLLSDTPRPARSVRHRSTEAAAPESGDAPSATPFFARGIRD